MNPTRYRPSSACRNLVIAGIAALGWAALAGVPASAATYQIPLADLVPSVGPLRMQVNSTSTIRVTISNQGGTSAHRPWVRMYLNSAVLGRKWGDLLSATGATCTQDDRKIDCRLRQNLAAGASQVIALNMRIDEVWPADDHELHIHADCGPTATHHNGGEIPESNESNNILVRKVTIHRPPDLEPTYMTSSFQNESEKTVYKFRDTTLSFRVMQNERFVSATNVKVTVATPNIDIKSLSFRVVDRSGQDQGSRGFGCRPSNSAPQIICQNGTLNWQDTLRISAVVRAQLMAPTVLSPVIVSVDPDRQIEEWNETNNIKTYNVRIR